MRRNKSKDSVENIVTGCVNIEEFGKVGTGSNSRSFVMDGVRIRKSRKSELSDVIDERRNREEEQEL